MDAHCGLVAPVPVQGPNSAPNIANWKRVITQDRVFLHYVPNSSIKHSKSDSKDRSQEIL
jgi:hypothetical protein